MVLAHVNDNGGLGNISWAGAAVLIVLMVLCFLAYAVYKIAETVRDRNEARDEMRDDPEDDRV